MQATTLSFSTIHLHGELFADMLRARHRTFVQRMGWELPVADGLEYDQYDTPACRWVVVHQDGLVRAGVRLLPTTTRCGIYSYMARDAQMGLLPGMPENLLFEEAPVDPEIWEASRIFVSEDVPARERARAQQQLITEMVQVVRQMGGARLLGIVPELGPRLARRTGLDCRPAGPVLDFGDGGQHLCVNICMVSARA